MGTYDVHNVLEEDFLYVVDLNNGLLLSYTHWGANIKICQYVGECKLIKSLEKYEWDTAEIISNKYVFLSGLKNQSIVFIQFVKINFMLKTLKDLIFVK